MAGVAYPHGVMQAHEHDDAAKEPIAARRSHRVTPVGVTATARLVS